MSRSLIDPSPEGVNAPEYLVSELAGVLKRRIEGEFDHIRVRGEVGRVSRPASGHVYLDLKDDRAVLAAVIWKGTGVSPKPEEGMEVIATGRLTTFPGQSKYQMIIESLAPAGIGALMAMLERRRAALAAEGLFDAAAKRPLPFLPRVIGVITSPSGAVIQDILHRLSDRFPVHVLVWPVVVQGERCAPEVAAAITGFSRLAPDGPVPRPDVLIVARGGGSVEDLWGFNDEAVVRAAAACTIPLISAVGHETDTTLIDHAADRRAPTPSAAAEMAVPVRAELLAQVADLQGRLTRIGARGVERRGQRLADLARALPRPQALVADRRQRLDVALARLARHADPVAAPAARLAAAAAGLPRAGTLLDPLRLALSQLGARLPWPGALLEPGRQELSAMLARLPRPQGPIDAGRVRLARVALPHPGTRLAREAAGLERAARRLRPALDRAIGAARLAASGPGARLRPALIAAPLAQGATRLSTATATLAAAGRRGIPAARERLATGARPLVPAITRALRAQADRLRALARMLGGLGPAQTLARGFVMVRDTTGAVLTRADQATPGTAVHLTFADATLSATLDPARRSAPVDPDGLSPPIPSPSPKGGREAPRREGGARGSRAKPPADPQGSLF